MSCNTALIPVQVKLFDFKLPFALFGHTSVEHTCGMLTFPVTFLLNNIINEYYGADATRWTVYLGLAMSIFVYIVIDIAQMVPYLNAPFNISKIAFDAGTRSNPN